VVTDTAGAAFTADEEAAERMGTAAAFAGTGGVWTGSRAGAGRGGGVPGGEVAKYAIPGIPMMSDATASDVETDVSELPAAVIEVAAPSAFAAVAESVSQANPATPARITRRIGRRGRIRTFAGSMAHTPFPKNSTMPTG
jgi:hypothetical protein